MNFVTAQCCALRRRRQCCILSQYCELAVGCSSTLLHWVLLDEPIASHSSQRYGMVQSSAKASKVEARKKLSRDDGPICVLDGETLFVEHSRSEEYSPTARARSVAHRGRLKLQCFGFVAEDSLSAGLMSQMGETLTSICAHCWRAGCNLPANGARANKKSVD